MHGPVNVELVVFSNSGLPSPNEEDKLPKFQLQ